MCLEKHCTFSRSIDSSVSAEMNNRLTEGINEWGLMRAFQFLGCLVEEYKGNKYPRNLNVCILLLALLCGTSREMFSLVSCLNESIDVWNKFCLV